jgi:phage shock protein E
MKTTLTLFFSLLLSVAFAQNVTQTDTTYRAITVVQADSLITANAGNPNFIIIDVRTASDFAISHIANAINIDFYNPVFDSIIQALDHSKSYLLYCFGGSRSTITYGRMQNWHFAEVYNMLGGISAWINAGYPVVTPTFIALTEAPKGNPIIYPNPVSGSFNVTVQPSYSGTLSLIDIAGNVIYSQPSATGVQNIDMTSHHSGIYFIRFDSASRSYTGKLILK